MVLYTDLRCETGDGGRWMEERFLVLYESRRVETARLKALS